jgi:nucleolar protein 12
MDTSDVGSSACSERPSCKAIKALFAKYGDVQSVRLRSVPVDGEGKMPRGGKVITGKLVADRNSTNAYVVFATEAGAYTRPHFSST